MIKKEIVKETVKPIATFRAGNVSASVFGNERIVDGKKVMMYNTTIQKSYTDKDNKWQTTNSYSQNDLSRLRVVVDKMLDYLYLGEESEDELY